jgi:hypothetical protein
LKPASPGGFVPIFCPLFDPTPDSGADGLTGTR